VPADRSGMRLLGSYVQRGSRVLKTTPKSQGALYTVPVNFAAAVDYNSGGIPQRRSLWRM
jgi:hypothetical protein